jgi:hypothetical protein
MNSNFKFDVTKPAFAFYISVRGLSRAKAEEHIASLVSEYLTDDVNMFFIPITDSSGGDTRVECIYNPTINQTIFRP